MPSHAGEFLWRADAFEEHYLQGLLREHSMLMEDFFILSFPAAAAYARCRGIALVCAVSESK